MDICIFGGAFDPVHKGHIAIAQSAVKRFNFDKLLFMVSKEPPHKSNHTASFTHRLNMVKLALNGLGSKFDVTDIEAKLNDLSYTYNSLSALKEIYPNAIIYVESILPVSEEVSLNHNYIKMSKINEYNDLLKEVAKEKGVYYLDISSAMANEQGYLPDDAATDGIHLNKNYCDKWLQYLKTHYIVEN